MISQQTNLKHQLVESTATREDASPAGHGEAFYDDPRVWVAAGFLLFMLLFVWKILPLVNKGLDDRAGKIRDQLDQAEKLRAEAEALLKQYKKEQKAIAKQADEVLANAKKEAAAIRANAKEELKAALARRSKQAEDNIKRAETDAVAQIKREIIDLATEKARAVLAAQLKGTKEDPTIAKAIAAVEHQIH